jgi:predicted DNA-binding transcriptional regulator AlpA
MNPTKVAPTPPAKLYYCYVDLLRLGYVGNRVSLGRMIKAGQFPPAVQLAPGRVGWRAVDLQEFDERILRGDTEPHLEWKQRAEQRAAKMAERSRIQAIRAAHDARVLRVKAAKSGTTPPPAASS